jgi:hypothetical protein
MDLLLFTKFEDFADNIAAIAVASQYSMSPNLCLFRMTMEILDLLK